MSTDVPNVKLIRLGFHTTLRWGRRFSAFFYSAVACSHNAILGAHNLIESNRLTAHLTDCRFRSLGAHQFGKELRFSQLAILDVFVFFSINECVSDNGTADVADRYVIIVLENVYEGQIYQVSVIGV